MGVHSKGLTNGGNVGSPDLLVGELCDEARLPHSTVAAQQNFEQVIVVSIHLRDYLTIGDTSLNSYFD